MFYEHVAIGAVLFVLGGLGVVVNRSNLIIESVDSINRDERGFPLTQYITNGGIPPSCSTADFQSNECITSP